MSKETFEIIKKEFHYVGILFLLSLAIFKIIFFKEELIVLFRMILSLFWLFVLPGYFAMLYWREKLDFTERLVVGIALSAAIIGISSYYIGIIGLDIKYHTILMPLMIMVVGIFISFYKKGQL